ncbi:unnamed protein product [Penicillium camemberti]|uniref:Str. FM013 n=1 Tax=Penicillium camemberti (strain FM 013) TaxID=1429867 RepID=A0A0G4PA75_PENC3|nr:unnamed protein product [Penicillium camemberti]
MPKSPLRVQTDSIMLASQPSTGETTADSDLEPHKATSSCLGTVADYLIEKPTQPDFEERYSPS